MVIFLLVPKNALQQDEAAEQLKVTFRENFFFQWKMKPDNLFCLAMISSLAMTPYGYSILTITIIIIITET